MKTIQEVMRNPAVHRGDGQIRPILRRPSAAIDDCHNGLQLVACRPIEVKTGEEGWHLAYYASEELARIL